MSIERTLVKIAGCLLMMGSAHAGTLHLVQSIPLDGVEGRIDHMAIDIKGQRLFVAALGNNSVEVLDLRAGKRVRSLTDFREPQGVAWIAKPGQLFVASGGDAVCSVVDGRTFAITHVGNRVEDADNVRHDAGAHRVYVGWGGGSLKVFDSTNWDELGEIRLPAHPEGFQLETRGPRIFADVPSSHRVAVINRAIMKAADSWPLKSAEENFTMALDEEHRRVFVGCRKPPTLVVLDSDSGKEVTAVSIDSDTDDIFFDAKRNRIYISCGAGFIDVLDSTGFKMLERIPTAGGARTSLFVPELNRFYVAVPHRGNQPAEVRVYETTGD